MPNGIPTLVIVMALMMAVLGGISILGHMYNLNGIKSKTVGDGQHGTSRWATRQEIMRIAANEKDEEDLLNWVENHLSR